MNPDTRHPTPDTHIAVIILAAGKGTRMKSTMPKVLHPVAGQPMLWHVLAAAQSLNPAKTVVITGYGADEVEAFTTAHFPGTLYARQTEQLGTGHAVMQAKPLLGGHTGPIVILYGDIMLSTRADVLPTLVREHAATPTGLTLLTAQVDNPTGFGRVFKQNGFLVNVEEKDCTPEQRLITTVNPCIYAVDGPLLWQLLDKVSNVNAQHEYYLTDILQLAAEGHHPISTEAVAAERPEIGMNTRAEIANMASLWQDRKRREMMLAGVTLTDPASVWFAPDTHIEADTTIHQNVVFGPGVHIGSGVTIEPFVSLSNSHIKPGTTVKSFTKA